MEVNDVRKDWLDNLREDARKRLRDAKIPVSVVGITGNAVQMRLTKAEDTEAALKSLKGSSSRSATPFWARPARTWRWPKARAEALPSLRRKPV